MSGDLENTALPVALYQRMPQLPTISTNGQQIPRIWLPEAIYEGKAEGYRWVGKSIEHRVEWMVGMPVNERDVSNTFDQHGDPLALFPFRRPGHYNESGHRLVADAVLAALSRQP